MSSRRSINWNYVSLFTTIVWLPLASLVAASCGDENSEDEDENPPVAPTADSNSGSNASDGTNGAVALPEGCMVKTPCESSVVGTWDLVNTTCTTFVLDATDAAECKHTVIKPEDSLRAGQLAFAADGTVSGTLTSSAETTSEYDRTCVEAKGGTLEQLCTERSMVETPLPMDGADEFVSIEGSSLRRDCAVEGDTCKCTETFINQYEFKTAAYGAEADGSELWLWKEENGLRLGKFCVDGDYLALSNAETTPTMLLKRAP